MIDKTELDYDLLQRQWKTILLGEDVIISNATVKQAVENLSRNAEGLLKTIQLNPEQVWEDLQPVQLSTNFRRCYNRLRTMALAYSTNGTSIFGDANALQTIIKSLDTITAEAYNSSTSVNKGENVGLSASTVMKCS